MRTDLRASGRSEHGAALPLVLLSMLSLSVMVVAFAAMSSREPLIAQNHIVAAQTFHIAEAGLEHAKRELLTADVNAILASNPPVINFQVGGNPRSFAGGTYSVQVVNNAGDPGPGDTDGRVFLVSTGTYGSATRQIRTLLELPVRDVPGALFMNNPQVDTKFTGDNFFISGKGTCPPGAICAPSTSPCAAADGCLTGEADKPGIGISHPTGNLTELTTEVNNTACSLRVGKKENCKDEAANPERREQVQGLGGDPSANPPVASVQAVPSPPPQLTRDAVIALANRLIAGADQRLSAGTYTINLTRNGQADGPPQVTVADIGTGLLTLSGSGVGRGTLVVKGRLVIQGDYRFEGLILAWVRGGNPEVRLAEGSRVFGGFIIVHQDTTRNTDIDIDVSGSARLVRSLRGLEFASQGPSAPGFWPGASARPPRPRARSGYRNTQRPSRQIAAPIAGQPYQIVTMCDLFRPEGRRKRLGGMRAVPQPFGLSTLFCRASGLCENRPWLGFCY